MPDPARTLLEIAAAPTLEWIWQDHRRTQGPIRPALALIGGNLFDPALDLEHLRKLCGLGNSRLYRLFHSAVGRPPFSYIEYGRLETACRLLTETGLKIFKIAELLGYSGSDVFSGAFSRWSGLTPTAYRRGRRLGAEGGASCVLRMARSAGLSPARLVRRCARGKLDPLLAAGRSARLRQLYPEAQ